jgi:hypothetical protein
VQGAGCDPRAPAAHTLVGKGMGNEAAQLDEVHRRALVVVGLGCGHRLPASPCLLGQGLLLLLAAAARAQVRGAQAEAKAGLAHLRARLRPGWRVLPHPLGWGLGLPAVAHVQR